MSHHDLTSAVRPEPDALLQQIADFTLATDRIPSDVIPLLASAMNDSPKLAKLVTMREELRQLWTRTNVSAEQLVVDLQAWCKKAESSGIVALEQFSMKLRAAHA